MNDLTSKIILTLDAMWKLGLIVGIYYGWRYLKRKRNNRNVQ